MADLTPEQTTHIDGIANRWITVGRSAGPTDRSVCEQAVLLAYKVAKLPLPCDESGEPCIMWVTDPKAGMAKAARFVILDRYLEQNKFNWSDNKPPKVAHLDLRRDVEQVFTLLGLPDPTREQCNEQRQTACYGQHDVYWCAFYEAMEYLKPDALGRDTETNQCVLDGLIAMTACGWWWPFDKGVILCERPVEAHFDDQGRLSNRNGPAMRFPSGYSLWIVNGVQIRPTWGDNGEAGRRVIEREMTVQDITGEQNSEVRRIMTELYGEAKFIQDLGAKPLDKSEHGTLYRVEVPDDEPLVMVRVEDSTPKPDGEREIYWLKVHPELRPLLGNDGNGRPLFGEPQALTALNAIASTAGLTGPEYTPSVQT